MKETYLNCLIRLKKFRKNLSIEQEIKKGKLYFSWLATKTEKIENEKDENYIYRNIVKFTLKNYRIDLYNYERLNEKLKKIVNNNYIFENNYYVFNNVRITKEDTMLLAEKLVFKRGNVVWIDFGFNVGNEFGGMHPAIILKNFNSELFVLPISSKKPKEYKRIEQDYLDKKITLEECQKRKNEIAEIIQIDKIYRFKDMTRWANITRMRKVSLLRLNFHGSIGKIGGNDINAISRKIRMEF